MSSEDNQSCENSSDEYQVLPSTHMGILDHATAPTFSQDKSKLLESHNLPTAPTQLLAVQPSEDSLSQTIGELIPFDGS
jgi:hypothetical protein